MAKIKKYRPGYFSGFKSEVIEFSSLNEMLAIDWVRDFSNDKNFYRFSISNTLDENYKYNLVAEYESGYAWWVVGCVDSDIDIVNELPIFNPKYK